VVVFDPLDGSSNVDANVTIGTIFGVYRKQGAADKPAELRDALQPGTALLAAGYTMYGSATTLVLTTGQGVNGFTLDPSLGEFVLTHSDIMCKPKHSIFSVNEGNSLYWDETTLAYVKSIKLPEGEGVKPYSARYVGSMVADVHRTLLYGGIFMYPADSRAPKGKLRLLYESNPMSMIIEQAGGKSTTGTERVLELMPTSIHQRCPIYIGSRECVDELLSFFAKKE
jgi:fructose-1,6-bisphosphatase I